MDIEDAHKLSHNDSVTNSDITDGGPQYLENRGLDLLEYPKVLNMLAAHTQFFASRDLALTTQPCWETESVDRLQAETSEAMLLIADVGDISLPEMPDVQVLVKRASLGGTLSGEDLQSVSKVLEATRRVHELVCTIRPKVPLLHSLAEQISDMSSVTRRIGEEITDHGTVNATAIPGLLELRTRVADGYQKVVRSLERTIESGSIRPALQSSVVATRGDRLVLEVKIEQRKAIPGIVHDISNTGATLFVEPFEAVDLCNQWREMAAETKRAEERVLRRLSGFLGEIYDKIISSLKATAEIDLIIARARLAKAMDASPIEMLGPGSDTPVNLIEARHPLLGENVVPVTVSVGPNFQGLVITGPNAGGKTVCLKTVGLLSLMHQTGLQIPASGDSGLGIFDMVYADIGDEQSIERSVSTFSSHLSNVTAILDNATPHSLVLLDELGTGTDPEEGSALARAVLAEFVKRDVTVIATTHHRSVAEFAGHSDEIENASMELDPSTHVPTYHLVMGLPGRSYGLAIARHLGLHESILSHAEDLVGSQHLDTQQLLSELQEERKKLLEVTSKAEEDRKGISLLRMELKDRLSGIGRYQQEIIDETQRRLRREVDELRKDLRRIERDARREGHYVAARQAADVARKRLRNPNWAKHVSGTAQPAKGSEEIGTSPVTPKIESEIQSLSPGDVVELKGLGLKAEVQTVENDGTVNLLVGGVTARLDMVEVRRLKGVKIANSEVNKYTFNNNQSTPAMSDEIDLRGLRAHEVGPALEVFLDRSMLNGVEKVRIVHGLGTGAVREAVHDALLRSPIVTTYGLEKRNRGGEGATWVELG